MSTIFGPGIVLCWVLKFSSTKFISQMKTEQYFKEFVLFCNQNGMYLNEIPLKIPVKSKNIVDFGIRYLSELCSQTLLNWCVGNPWTPTFRFCSLRVSASTSRASTAPYMNHALNQHVGMVFGTQREFTVIKYTHIVLVDAREVLVKCSQMLVTCKNVK